MSEENLERSWESDIVMGWCDSAGCKSVGHRKNNCRLARVLAGNLDAAEDAGKKSLKEQSSLLVEAREALERIVESHCCAEFTNGCPRHQIIGDRGGNCPLTKAGKLLAKLPSAEKSQSFNLLVGLPLDPAISLGGPF